MALKMLRDCKVTLEVDSSEVFPGVCFPARRFAEIIGPTLDRFPNCTHLACGLKDGRTVFTLIVIPYVEEPLPSRNDWLAVIHQCPPPSTSTPSAAHTPASSASSKSP